MASKTTLIRKARRAAQRHGVDPDIFVRQINQESGFRDVRSPAGAEGYAQFIPSTAKAYGVDVHDPDSSFDGAARYMKANLKKYGSYRAALSVYNSGSPSGYKRIAETRNYVKTILGGKNPSYSGGGDSTQQIEVPGATVPGTEPSLLASATSAPEPLPELRQSTIPSVPNPTRPDFAAAPRLPQGGSSPLDLSEYKSSTLPSIADQLAAAAPAQGLPEPESPDIEVPSLHATVTGGTKRTPIKGSGGYAGSQGIAESLGGVTGLQFGSQKRARKLTANDNVSDHYEGNETAYAIDLNSRNNNPKALERGARRIAKELGIRGYRPGRVYNVNRNGYRIQLIYGAAVDHADHVHIGVKKL